MSQAKLPAPQSRWQGLAGLAAIVIPTVLVYLPALRGAFVWDDDLLVMKNPLLETWSGLGEIWAFGRTADYFPLTNTVFWIEWHLFGLSPVGYHVVNIALQIGNSLLIWAVLNRLRIPGAWLTALIFAIHPVHVSSVAWISELKNVLSLFWALVSVWFFVRFLNRESGESATDYFVSLIAFVLALLSKTQVIFLPVVLLLLMCARTFSAATSGPEPRHSSRRNSCIGRWPMNFFRSSAGSRYDMAKPALLALLPFFAIAVVLGLITIAFQLRGLGEEEVLLGGLPRRVVNAGMAVWWYTGKIFAPYNLMAIYPNWRFDSPALLEWLPAIALAIVVSALWFFRGRGTLGPFVALAAFIVALGPILGFVKMAYARSGTLVADHLQYSANVFLLALIGAAIGWLWQRAPNPGKVFLATAVTGLLVAAGMYSSSRAAVFRSEETLWTDNLARNPDAWQAHNRLGQYYFDRSRYAEAAPHFERAAALKPEVADNYNQLGLVYARLGRVEEGIAQYRHALELKERNPVTARSVATAIIRTNLANALALSANNMTERGSYDATEQQEAKRRYDEAIVQYEKALEIQPRHPAIHRNLGILLARMGRYQEAVQHLKTVLEIVPNEPNAREVLDEIQQHQTPSP